MKLTAISEFLKRSKIPVDIGDADEYKRVTIKIKHNGVSLRDVEIGKKIGTKKQFILKSGQFILSKIDARYGAFGIAPEEVDGAIITGNFWAYDVDFTKLNIDWFNQYTNSPAFYDLCERASTGITHRKYLNETFFLNYKIELPSVDEQLAQIEEIKKQKASFGQLTTQLETQLSLVKQLRQSFLSEAMQGKLICHSERSEESRETGQQLLARIKAEKAQLVKDKKLKKEKELPPINAQEIPFEIPEDWVWCRLGEICTKITDGFHNTPNKLSEGKIYISATHIREKGIKWSDCLYVSDRDHQELFRKAYPKKGEILITNRGAGCSTPVIIDIDEEFSFQNAALIGFNQQLVNNKYLFYFILKSRDEIMETFVNGGLQPMLSNIVLSKIPVSLPPLSEQNQIVAKLDELMQFCDDLENSIKESQLQNEQLLQQVLKEALEVREGVY